MKISGVFDRVGVLFSRRLFYQDLSCGTEVTFQVRGRDFAGDEISID